MLALARQLITVEQRWCQGAFARGWFDIAVPVRSGFARRFCALGAVRRAGRDLGLIVEPACTALELQTGRPVADWNDDPKRTHGEVVAAFDAAIAVLEHAP